MSGFDLSNFIASFFDEAKERLSSINQGLVDFEAGTLSDEGLNDLRRDAHTIKGSALMLGVNDIGEVAHIFEDMVEALMGHPEWRDTVAVQFLYDMHDMLGERLEDIEGLHLLDFKAVAKQFQHVLQALQDGKSVADPVASLAKEVSALSTVKEEADTLEAESEAESEADLDDVYDADEHASATSQADKDKASIFRPLVLDVEKKTGARKTSGRFFRVDAERLEALSHQVIEMSTEQSRGSKAEQKLQEAHLDFRTLRREWRKMRLDLEENGYPESVIKSMDELFDAQLRQLKHLVQETRYQSERNVFGLKELRDQVLSLMLRPLDNIFSTFPRAVRDVASKIGKNVRLVVDGKTVQMDQGVAESLVEPLVHLLTNAVAHGIEDEQTRIALGKPAQGQVAIIARQNGSEVRLEVIDDGRGIDTSMIKKVAVERGVTTQDEADAMSQAELLELIFRPGFSTLKAADALAGRGIGMNVVQNAIRKLTGNIKIESKVGLGTKFIVSVPVSVAVQQAVMFRMGNEKYCMLTHMVEQAVAYQGQTISHSRSGKAFMSYDSQQVPIVDLRRMMSSVDTVLSSKPYIIIAEHIEGYVGIVVDELFGDTEIVVHDLDPYLKRYQPQGLMGNTIIDDGSVVMLLEPYGIKEMGRTSPDQNLSTQIPEEEKNDFRILLVDDSLIAREVEKGIFEKLGFVVETAIDGMDGLEKLESGEFDMVVTDLEMPRLDGFGFVRQMRNQSKYAEMLVMVISTRESPDDRLRALDVGADSYMVKQHLNATNIIATVKALVSPSVVQERGLKHQINAPE